MLHQYIRIFLLVKKNYAREKALQKSKIIELDQRTIDLLRVQNNDRNIHWCHEMEHLASDFATFFQSFAPLRSFKFLKDDIAPILSKLPFCILMIEAKRIEVTPDEFTEICKEFEKLVCNLYAHRWKYLL